MMAALWSDVRRALGEVHLAMDEDAVNPRLDLVVVLSGVEHQVLWDELEELDDDADPATDRARKRFAKVQRAMERLRFPLEAKPWRAFADALTHHLDENEREIRGRLAALAEDDRHALGALVRQCRDTLAGVQ